MKIKVEGKAHLKGVAKKTGNPYDFIQVHYLGRSRNVEGRSCEKLGLNPGQFPYEHIFVGQEYNVDFDNTGYPVDFSPADKAAFDKAVAALKF